MHRVLVSTFLQLQGWCLHQHRPNTRASCQSQGSSRPEQSISLDPFLYQRQPHTTNIVMPIIAELITNTLQSLCPTIPILLFSTSIVPCSSSNERFTPLSSSSSYAPWECSAANAIVGWPSPLGDAPDGGGRLSGLEFRLESWEEEGREGRVGARAGSKGGS